MHKKEFINFLNILLTGQVTSVGKTFSVPCNADGSVVLPSPMPTCKVPVNCPAPPAPPASSKLSPSASANLTEYSSAVYTCTTGFTLVNVTATGVSNNQFLLTCGSGGTFPASPSWPTCKATSCATVPTMTGFVTTAVAPVVAGLYVQYTCATAGQVRAIFKYNKFFYIAKWYIKPKVFLTELP